MSAKIAIVISRFNPDITNRLLQGAVAACKKKQISLNQEDIYDVPGAIEIPLITQALAKTQHYDAIIALGAVIQGETRHFDYVCEQVSRGCQKVMLKFEIPVIFGILTTKTEKQALARSGGKMGNKGQECVDTAIEMIELLQKIQTNKYKNGKRASKPKSR